MVSVTTLIAEASGRLDSRFEARQLMLFTLRTDNAGLLLRGREEINADDAELFEALVKRRENGEPLQYILGEWEFYGLNFLVGRGVLIPRQDTETLVSCILRHCGASPRILELGAGSGCICCTLAKQLPSARVYAVEKSPEAFEYLKKNIALHGLDVKAELGDALLPDKLATGGCFDIIVSNPPYLTDEDMRSLQREVRFEPRCALDGGGDGLYFYRGFTKLWADRLLPNGSFFYEAGLGQTDDIADILRENGLEHTEIFPDATGRARVVRGFAAQNNTHGG